MKLLIIRHADPDYAIDSLTEKGWREAKLLSKKLCKLDIKDFYTSPLGRAKDTASFTLKGLNRTATELEWLKEFPAPIERPDRKESNICWDWLPADWTSDARLFDRNLWYTVPAMADGNVGDKYKNVTESFDKLLSEHGYERYGDLYKVTKSNRDTIVLFCHFGLECVLLSHLMNVSPMNLWHHFAAAPSSVTTINTEERREGTAIFRISAFGDISHLYAENEEPAFACRFCETYDCDDERHD